MTPLIKGLSPDEVNKREGKQLNSTRKVDWFTFAQRVKKSADDAIIESIPVKLRSVDIQTEAHLVEGEGHGYKRIYATDHMPLTDEQVDDVVATYQKVFGNGGWLHVHCDAGAGRTGQVMNMIDMLNNANTLSFGQIVARQAALDAASPVNPPAGTANWKLERFENTSTLLEAFYNYAQVHPGGQGATFSEWKEGDRSIV